MDERVLHATNLIAKLYRGNEEHTCIIEAVRRYMAALNPEALAALIKSLEDDPEVKIDAGLIGDMTAEPITLAKIRTMGIEFALEGLVESHDPEVCEIEEVRLTKDHEAKHPAPVDA